MLCSIVMQHSYVVLVGLVADLINKSSIGISQLHVEHVRDMTTGSPPRSAGSADRGIGPPLMGVSKASNLGYQLD